MKNTGGRLRALGMIIVAGLFAGGALQAQVPAEVGTIDWCPGGKDCLGWSAVVNSDSYNVYRGAAADLVALSDGMLDSCTVGSFVGTTTGSMVDGDPAAGSLYWFLVTASNPAGEGEAGSGASGPRVVNSQGVCVPAGGLVINEIDYDQPGSDAGEFIEIYNAGGVARDLADLAVVLVNGLTGQEYERIELSGAGSSLPAGAYLVVGSPGIVAALPPGTPSIEFAASSNNIQNGAPDGVALLDIAAPALVDALSYEGTIEAAQFDGIPGTFDLVEGTPATAADSNSSAGSLARIPDGVDSGDADSDWSFVAPTSPGAANVDPG